MADIRAGRDVPISIAAMPPMWLWLSPESIGSSFDESERAARNEISPARAIELQAKAEAAFHALRLIPVPPPHWDN
jgi:hypothetical protein